MYSALPTASTSYGMAESCSKYVAKGEMLLLGDFNARLGAIMGDRGIVYSNGKLLLPFLHSAFADGDNGDYKSLLNASFDCKCKPTREESGRTSIIDYLITAPESLQRVDKVHVECRNQTASPNALGSDHHLLYIGWKVTPVADTSEDPRRRITNYLKLQDPEIQEAYQLALDGELQQWALKSAPFCNKLDKGHMSDTCGNSERA
jgi:hypothetical protein